MFDNRINIATPSFGSLAKHQLIVDDKLIRGRAVLSPYRLYQMKKEGINQVIDLRNTSYVKRPLEKFFCGLLGVKYKNFRYSYRNPELPSEDFFTRLNKTITDNEGKTYIHCEYGKRRTGVCVAVYEKFHTPKCDRDIINDMVDLGFQEIKNPNNTRKVQKIKTIYNNLLEKYFPALKKVD